MKRAWVGLFFVTVAASAGWIACVGDEPATTTGGTDAGGDSALDGGVATDSGSGGGDASTSDAGSDASPPCVADAGTYDINPGYIYCPRDVGMCSALDGGNNCCAAGAHDSCKGGGSCNTATGANITCLLPSQCNVGTTTCCVQALDAGVGFDDIACPRRASVNQTLCKTSCSEGERATCTTDGDCTKIDSHLSCKPYLVSYNGDPDAATDVITVGICAP